MRRVSTAGSFAVLVVALGAVPAPAYGQARTTSSHCATHDEYRKVDNGDTVERVARILGHRGTVGAAGHDYRGHKAQYRHYPACQARTSIEIIFTRRANGKYLASTGAYTTKPAPHCATHADFMAVHDKMTIDEVADLLGHRGSVADQSDRDGHREENRSYPTCSAADAIVIGFTAQPHQRYYEYAKSGTF